MIFVVDCLIALLYNIDIMLEPRDEFTDYMLTEIWIRPTITYGLVPVSLPSRQNNRQTTFLLSNALLP